MLKNVRWLMLVCTLVAIGSADQNIGEQNIGGWAPMSRRSSERITALASSVEASIPTVRPQTRPDPPSGANTHPDTCW